MSSTVRPPGQGQIPARQARSQRTEERIVAAAVDLLGEKGFDGMTVGEIARRAGISVGGFYARFPGKEALLQYLNNDVLGAVREGARERFSVQATRELDARQVIERYIAMAVDVFRRHRLVMQQVSRRSRTSADPGFRQQVLDANIELHDLFRARLHERLDTMDHPVPHRAIDIALTSVSAAMREYVLFDEYRPQFEPIDDPDLVAELTDLFVCYLRIHS